MNIAWDAANYADNFSFVPAYGKSVLELVRPGKGLAVDLGCGTGALSPGLEDKGYEVIGIDDSEAMLEKARETYPGLAFIKGNALDFSLERKADVIFSNAVFHWIDAAKQEALAENLSHNLRRARC